MQRTFVIAMLGACLLPAAAFAAGQNPISAPQAHPAASAHANAVVGEADAANIEACTSATKTLIDKLEAGEYKTATADFDAAMLANLDAGKLGEVWQDLGKQIGKLASRGTPQNVMVQGHTIVTLPLHFAKADLNAQVACDADGKIAGFFLRPAQPQPSR